MPKSRPYPASAPSANQYGSASQPWDALKNELEDLLGQVQDQISEFEGDHVQEPQPKQPVARPMSAANDLEMRRQEALANVRSAVDRLGAKQDKPKKKKSWVILKTSVPYLPIPLPENLSIVPTCMPIWSMPVAPIGKFLGEKVPSDPPSVFHENFL